MSRPISEMSNEDLLDAYLKLRSTRVLQPCDKQRKCALKTEAATRGILPADGDGNDRNFQLPEAELHDLAGWREASYVGGSASGGGDVNITEIPDDSIQAVG